MRQLTRQHGLTLIELMVALIIAALLMVAGLPAYADYIANSRLREGANLVVTASQFARSEAIKRNQSLRLDIASGRLTVTPTASGSTELRSFEVPATFQATGLPATFDSTGRTTPFGTSANICVTSSQRACSGDLRCPWVKIDASGAASLQRTGSCS